MHPLLMLLTVVASTEAAPPEPSLASNRPGFSYAAGLTPVGRWITEVGIHGQLGDVNSLSVPVASARLGLTEGAELSLVLPGYSRGPAGSRGLTDLAVGAKFGAAPRSWLAYSVLAHLIVPVGDRGIGDPAWQVLGAVNVELSFARHAWASLNTQVDSFTASDGSRQLAVTPSAALGYTLFGALNPFVQTYLRYAEGEPSPFVGAGVAWLVTSQVQLDLSADYDIDGQAVGLDGGVAVLW